jgi:dihydroflavonol-4-reductase
MKVLITGGSGFIGSHLLERLLNHKYHIKCLVRENSDLRWIKNLPVEFVYGDVCDFNSLLPIVQNVDYIYHLGGILRTNTESEYFHVNYEGTKNLLTACSQLNSNLKRFIYISSQAAAGPSVDGIPLTENDPPQPISCYGKSKQLAELAVLEFQKFFPVTIIRPPVVYGPRDDDTLEVFKYIKFRIKPLIGNQEKIINLIHVHDLVRGIQLAAEHSKAENQIFFIANSKGYSWTEVEDAIAQVMERKAMTIRFPEFVLDVAASLSEQVAIIFKNSAIINRDKAAEMKQSYWIVDTSKIEQQLGFISEIPLQQGLKETYNWYRMHGWL